jgi:PD-(D/E)XK nuclease superfamily
MEDVNLLKHFVVAEEGTTCLLATMLDPCFGDVRQSAFRDSFRERLATAGISLKDNSVPFVLRPEYLNIDLAMLWDDWILLIENKVAAASVTRNQLSMYYDAALKQLQSGTFLGHPMSPQSRVAMIYLTPSVTIGAVEFVSLELRRDRRDAKTHLAWPDLLHDARRAFPETSTDPFGRLLADGSSLLEAILRTKPIPKIAATLERIAAKDLLRRIETRIVRAMGQEPGFRTFGWRGLGVEEIFANIGGRDANVFFDIYADETDAVDPANVRLHATLAFRVAGTAPRSKKNRFAEFPTDHWDREVGLPPGSLSLDRRGFLVLDIRREGTIDPLVEESAELFCRFLSVFRPFF